MFDRIEAAIKAFRSPDIVRQGIEAEMARKAKESLEKFIHFPKGRYTITDIVTNYFQHRTGYVISANGLGEDGSYYIGREHFSQFSVVVDRTPNKRSQLIIGEELPKVLAPNGEIFLNGTPYKLNCPLGQKVGFYWAQGIEDNTGSNRFVRGRRTIVYPQS